MKTFRGKKINITGRKSERSRKADAGVLIKMESGLTRPFIDEKDMKENNEVKLVVKPDRMWTYRQPAG